VLDVNGRVVRILLDETRPAGRHSAVWNGHDRSGVDVGPGIYFVRMEAGEFTAIRKMLLLR